jgi:methyl-accepting chemotaxis protein
MGNLYRMQMGIVQKLIAGLATILTAVALFTVIFFSSREAANVEEAIEDKAMVMATLASNAAAGGLEFDDKDSTADTIKPFGKVHGVNFVVVFSGKGEEFATWQSSEFEGAVPVVEYSSKALLVRGDNSVIATQAIESGGNQIGQVIVGLSLDAVDDAIWQSRRVTITVGLFIIITGCSVFWVMANRMVRPIRDMVARLQDIAEGEGDLTKRLEIDTQDELGEMARWFNLFVEKLQNSLQRIGEQAQSITIASRDLNGISGDLETTTVATSEQSMRASDGSTEVSGHVQRATEGVTEMEVSISEISRNVNEVSRVARTAVEAATQTASTVVELEESSGKIDNVLKVISSIAAQTNLLALNATIEAARAGEAGKGFAVVANEVKELAKETAKATDDVRKLVESIAVSSHAAVDAIGDISKIIDQIDSNQTAIASAVEQQATTANEVGTTIGQASNITGDIAESIRDVAETAQGNTEHSAKLLQSAKAMAMTAEELQRIVSEFRY